MKFRAQSPSHLILRRFAFCLACGLALTTACGSDDRAGDAVPSPGDALGTISDAGAQAFIPDAAPAPDLMPPLVPPDLPMPVRTDGTTCLVSGAYPPLISQTGCYGAGQTLTAGLILYEVASPLWTDGAGKKRYLALPPSAQIEVDISGGWTFPNGAVLLKEFRVHLQEDPADKERLVETRLMVKTEDGWIFAGYRWNPEGTDASLVQKAAYQEYVVSDATGAATTVRYLFPAPNDCTTCHSRSVVQAFGPSALQLALNVSFDGVVRDQLHTLSEVGLFSANPTRPARTMVDPRDESATLHDRARSWLHANCSHCHQPGGWTPPGMTMDFRFDQALSDAHICNVKTEYLTRIPRLSPGNPAGSAIWRRLNSQGYDRMPPVGVSVRDPAADVVRRWIESMTDCSDPRAEAVPNP